MIDTNVRDRSIRRFGLVVFATALITAVPASGQSVDGFSLGVAGGFVRGPASPFSTSAFGYYVQSTLEGPSPSRFVRPRADLFFADWGEHVTALTANVVLTPLPGRRVAPYLLAGAGAYASRGAGAKSGWTVGAGLRLPGDLRSITIESRLHAYLGGNSPNPLGTQNRWRYLWTPIGLGIQF